MKKKIGKPKKKDTIKKLKKETKKVKDEWNKAIKQFQNFDPMKDMEMPDIKKQLKDFNFKLDSKCDL